MRTYGDLCFEKKEGDIDLSLKEKLEKVILQSDKTFDGIWTDMLKNCPCEEKYSKYTIPYKNASILLDEKPEFRYDLLYSSKIHGSRYYNLIRWENAEKFQENLSWYVDNLSLYKKDIEMCLMFNLDLDSRKKKNKDRDRCNDSADLINESVQKYILPFNLSENKYDDFCAYTWRALFKNMPSLECFKDYSDRKRDYLNARGFEKILQSLFCEESGVELTVNDCWLTEKIFGISAVLAMFPLVLNYYDKKVWESVFCPLFDLIIKCQPINIRISLADLICKFLLDLSKNKNNPFFHDGSNNKLYDSEAIKELESGLEKKIKAINKKYQTLIHVFYSEIKNKRIESFEYDSRIFIFPEESKKFNNNIFGGSQEVFKMILNKGGFMEVWQYLENFPKKRNYNSGNPTGRFAILQSEAIQASHNMYHYS